MNPTEVVEYFKAFGIPGGMAAAMFWLWMTRPPAQPGKSPLEEDIKAMRDDMKAVRDDLRDVRERVSHIEGRMERK